MVLDRTKRNIDMNENLDYVELDLSIFNPTNEEDSIKFEVSELTEADLSLRDLNRRC